MKKQKKKKDDKQNQKKRSKKRTNTHIYLVIHTGSWTGVCQVSRLCHWVLKDDLSATQAGAGFVSTWKSNIL